MTDRDWTKFSLAGYLRDKAPAAAVLVACLAVVSGMLTILAVTPSGILMVNLVLLLGIVACVWWDFHRKAQYYADLAKVRDELEHVRHLSAFLEQPRFLEGTLTWEAFEALAKCSGDELAQTFDDATAYRRYVETWIHEVKTPIAASRLILARMRGPEATALRQELELIERYVEQSLYFSRSENLSKDYVIKEVALAEVVSEACKRNQNLLIASGAMPSISIASEQTALADASWLTFVLGQLLANSAKYGAKSVAVTAHEEGEGSSRCVKLEVADDGVGIPAEDMPHVFDRGFVGVNGREEGSATGMGLYLCAKLCASMGLGIEAFSEVGNGTRIVITLPLDRSRFLSNLTEA